MTDQLRQRITEVLDKLPIPGVEDVTVADVAELAVNQKLPILKVNLGFPCAQFERSLLLDISNMIRDAGIENLSVEIVQNIPAIVPRNTEGNIKGVKNIIAVASGKGGVGKSTTAANLALALKYEGANVGILDADIYGPSQPQMLGVADKRPEMYGPNMIEPIAAWGLKLVSMGNLITENTPMVWRGPMVSGALQQLLQNTHWADLDYLVVDMPPGTGDIQLTLSQSVPVSGAVIVTTPQDIALLDARKGIEMFRKVNIPVLGIVENMAVHTCSQCGHREPIFGEDGARKLAEEYDTQVLGLLPLKMEIRELADSGKPSVAADPESEVSREYRSIARSLSVALWQLSSGSPAAPEISFADD